MRAPAVPDRRAVDRPVPGLPPRLARRRPVRSFVGALALVCLVLTVVARSGVAAPQVRMRATGSLDAGPESCGITYSLVNDGFRPVEVEAVAWPEPIRVPGPTDDISSVAALETLEPTDLAVFAPFTLPGRAGREIVAPFPCAAAPPVVEPIVHLRSADTGLVRDVRPGST